MSILDSYSDVLPTAFEGETNIVLDIEGVDLSRCGSICIVQVATTKACFLLDLLGKTRDDPLVNWLRGILEDASITKIIHDCRMDSDALSHLLGIRLTNVHDTASWHAVVTGNEDQNLNTVLEHNGIKPNTIRDGNVYITNPAFWATRPLTSKMIEWAVGDVMSLFEVKDKQTAKATASQAQKAAALSDARLSVARDASLANVKVITLVQYNTQQPLNLFAGEEPGHVHRHPWLQPPQSAEVHVHAHLHQGLQGRPCFHGVLHNPRGLGHSEGSC